MPGELANRLRELRAERGISQAELAEAIGVSRKTINTIEVGRFVPSTVIALRLARHFRLPVEQVFALEEG